MIQTRFNRVADILNQLTTTYLPVADGAVRRARAHLIVPDEDSGRSGHAATDDR